MKKGIFTAILLAAVLMFICVTITAGSAEAANKANKNNGSKSAVKAKDGRFIAYEDGTVLDTKTKLMWAAKDNGSDINWNDAKKYCESYRGGGHADWRMPTREELSALFDGAIANTTPPSAGCSGGYHITNLINMTCCCAWASDTSDADASNFNFYVGLRGMRYQSFSYNLRALPVRDGK